jgi:hypothetical protein
MLSNEVGKKLEPLRVTLGLTGNEFREGVFSWRGFLYYKWSMSKFWTDVMAVLREIDATIMSELELYYDAMKPRKRYASRARVHSSLQAGRSRMAIS